MSTTKRSLRGAVALVTGGAAGIGAATAAALAGRGARVAILDLDPAAAARTAAGLQADGAEALGLGCDVADEASVAAAVASVRERWGGIDVLINNAGITHVATMGATDAATYRRVFGVNVFGAIHSTRAVLDDLVARKGAVVAISSVAGFAPLWSRSAYSASKHALHGLFDTLRSELDGSGVDVLIVCPGFTDTGIASHAAPGSSPRNTAGRLARPEDVAAALVEALESRRQQVVLTRVGKASYWISRFAPRIYARLMLRSMKRPA